MVLLTSTVQSVLTRVVTFHARHRYHKASWSPGENARRFGVAGDAGGHGHLYRVEVSVAGPLDVDTQMIIDLAALDEILADVVTSRLDGRSLNDVVPVFASGEQLPSCEAIARSIWTAVAPRLPDAVRLHRVRVAEDETLWADCIG